MTGKLIRLILCTVVLPAVIVFGSGFSWPPPGPPEADSPSSVAFMGEIEDITMAQFIAMEQDRRFDYSFSFRYVKSGDISYYVRYSSLYMCEGLHEKHLLDNAFVYWMYIDRDGDLWFCVRGAADITGGELLERKALYRYDRSSESFSLFKQESGQCVFSNRFFRQFFLFWERGYLKAYDTDNEGTYLLGQTNEPAVVVSQDGEALYFTDRQGRKIRLTGLGEKKRSKEALKLTDFPLGIYTFDEIIIDNRQALLAYYRFNGVGYAKVSEFYPLSERLYDAGITFFTAPGGIGAIEDPGRACMSFYNLSTRLWSRIGDAEQADASGISAGTCWFYTCHMPIRLYVIRTGSEYKYSFGSLIDGCSSIRVANGRAYVFQYDEDWLTHVFEMGTGKLYRISN